MFPVTVNKPNAAAKVWLKEPQPSTDEGWQKVTRQI